MSSIWNFLSPIRTGYVFTNMAGIQLYGTVVRHGINDKTINVLYFDKVRVSHKYWNNKYQYYRGRTSTYHVHDEQNICVTGDKVLIRGCEKLTNKKAYYVQQIIKPYPRSSYSQFQKRVNSTKLQ